MRSLERVHRIKWKAELAIQFQRLFWFNCKITGTDEHLSDYFATFRADIRTLLVGRFFVTNQTYAKLFDRHSSVLT